jgi:HK97 family phage major capsid protein
MPVGYSGQVVALVNQYGSARRYGTVFPLGTGTVKLPKLSTDTAFGLIARSAAVTEKSPQTAWVTFTAEKFGGLVRLPSEMSEDSIIGIGQFIAEYAARQLAAVEDQVFFLNLDGSTFGAVKGLCGSTIDNSKVTQMASTKTHYSDATLGNVRTLRNVPDASALRKGAYYMHPSFEQLLSSFNTAGDRPYNPNAQLNNPSAAQPFITGPTLDGFPVRWVDQLPAYSTSVNASKVFILFGDLSFQYLGVTGAGIRIETSVEAAFDTDEILIRALERFTIGLMANGAVGGLETAGS